MKNWAEYIMSIQFSHLYLDLLWFVLPNLNSDNCGISVGLEAQWKLRRPRKTNRVPIKKFLFYFRIPAPENSRQHGGFPVGTMSRKSRCSSIFVLSDFHSICFLRNEWRKLFKLKKKSIKRAIWWHRKPVHKRYQWFTSKNAGENLHWSSRGNIFVLI